MKYCVTYKIEGRFISEVEANSIEEARNLARNEYYDSDFGALSDIEGEDIMVEDENGKNLWERYMKYYTTRDGFNIIDSFDTAMEAWNAIIQYQRDEYEDYGNCEKYFVIDEYGRDCDGNGEPQA